MPLKRLSRGCYAGLGRHLTAVAGIGGLYCEDGDIAGIAVHDSQALVGVKEYAIDPEQAQRLWALSASLTGIDAFA